MTKTYRRVVEAVFFMVSAKRMFLSRLSDQHVGKADGVELRIVLLTEQAHGLRPDSFSKWKS